MDFDTLFVNASGRTSRGRFIPALLTLLAVVLFYAFIVKGRTATFCLLVLMFPAIVLQARRLHDMGRSAWLLVVPAVLMLLAFGIWLKYLSFGAQVDGLLRTIALIASGAVALWCAVGGSQAQANRFGAPATA